MNTTIRIRELSLALRIGGSRGAYLCSSIPDTSMKVAPMMARPLR